MLSLHLKVWKIRLYDYKTKLLNEIRAQLRQSSLFRESNFCACTVLMFHAPVAYV